MEAVVIVPCLPPVEANVNWRGSWQQRARAVRAFREAAGWAVKASLGANNSPLRDFLGYQGTITLDANVSWHGRRKFADPTSVGILLKAAIDGLADVLWDGEDRHVELGRVRQTRGAGVVIVTLRAEGEW